MIKTVDELRVKLEGKTERTEIEAILNGATIPAMKGYIDAERYDICTGRNLHKIDYVNGLTSMIYSLVPEENTASVADKEVISFFKTILSSKIDAEKYVRVYASQSLYEKITSTSEPHKFSNLPEAEIRVMLGFDAVYGYLGSERGMYGLFTNDLNTVNVEDTAKAAKYFEELVMRVFNVDYYRATTQEAQVEEAPIVTEAIKSAETVEDIANALMRCGKVKDMTEAYRAVTGENFYGKIVGVKKDELAYNMSMQMKKRLEVEAFKGLALSEKTTKLCMMDGYEAGCFLHVCTLDELHKVAEIIGADTSKVNTENEITEKLDYMEAITHKLIMSPNGIKIHFPEPPEVMPAESSQEEATARTTTAIRFEVGRQYYGINETGDKVAYTVKKVTPKFVTLSVFSDDIAPRYSYREENGVEIVIDEVTPRLHYTIRADKPVDSEYKPVASEKKVAHERTQEEKDRAKASELLRKYASATEWIVRIYRDAMSNMTDDEYESKYGYKPTICDKVEEWLYNGETSDGTSEFTNCYDYARGLGLKPRGCSDDEDFESRYDELIPKMADIIARIGASLTESARMAEKAAEESETAEGLYADEAYSDAPGDNSHPEEDIPESHMPEETPAKWTEEDYRAYFPNGEMRESELVELTSSELDALNDYLARKDVAMWRELNGIRAGQKYPLVVMKKSYIPPEDMMLYPIQADDSYDEMREKLDKNFEMVDKCKDGTDMQYLFYTCGLHTAYMMLKARGYKTRLEEWQSIKDNVVHDFIQQELARRENFLKRETISKKKKEITAMVNKYAEIHALVRIIRDGIKFFLRMNQRQIQAGEDTSTSVKAICEVKKEYRKQRLEGFKLRRKLLRVMNVAEIRRACEAYIARCEEIRRRHIRK